MATRTLPCGAAAVGFDDEVFHAALGSPSVLRLDHLRVREPFGAWSANADRTPY